MIDNTILDYPDELLRLSLSFLGFGHFAFIAPVCSRFKTVYLANASGNKKITSGESFSLYLANVSGNKKFTSGESVTSSISRSEKYFEDAGTDSEEQHILFWYSVSTRYGRVDVMEWAHTQGHSRVWNARFRGGNTGHQVCTRAAEYGQLAGLQWLRQNGCSWNSETSSGAAKGGHLSVLQWVRENGCEWDRYTCSAAAGGGHLTVLQ